MIQYFKIDTNEIKKMSINPVPPRQKEYHEVMWVQKGNASFIIDGDKFLLNPNSFFIIPKSRIHQFIPSPNVEGQVIRFTEDELLNFPRLLFSKFNKISEISISFFDIKQFGLLFDGIKLEWDNLQRNNSFLVGLFSLVIQRINQIKINQLISNKDHIQQLDILDKFQILLDEYIHEEKVVDFYAHKLNISPRKLNQVIKSLLNDTATNIISQRLIIEAKRKLVYSGDAIYEIAYSLGFKDNSHFTKFFKKYSNYTPREYRNIF